MRNIICTAIACLTVLDQGNALIVEAPNLARLEQELQFADENTLVMFDVDDTLLYPKELILRKCNNDVNEELVNSILKNPEILPPDRYEKHYLHTLVLTTTEFILIDPKVVPLISSLQKRNIPTIAFTKMGSWSLGIIPSLTEFRISQLKKQGIDFSEAFKQPQFPQFQVVVKGDKSFCFKGGVLFSNEFDKGPILTMFLEALKWKPSKIIFLDDRYDYLETVEEALSDSGIEFTGIYYTAAKNESAPLDRDVAEFQFRYLAEHGKWLDDEQARLLLNKAL